jgi:prefoldin subunit 5
MSTRSKILTVFFWLLLLVAIGLTYQVERQLDSRLNSMQEQIDSTSKMLEAMTNE